jgi:hypothetical protein
VRTAVTVHGLISSSVQMRVRSRSYLRRTHSDADRPRSQSTS